MQPIKLMIKTMDHVSIVNRFDPTSRPVSRQVISIFIFKGTKSQKSNVCTATLQTIGD